MASVPVAIDLGWLLMLETNLWHNTEFCRTDLSRHVRLGIFHQELEGIARGNYRELLLFLEQLVVNDQLVVDATAVQRLKLKLPRELSPFIQQVAPPRDVYLQAAERTLELRAGLVKASASSQPLAALFAEMDNQADGVFWSSVDKNYHDAMRSAHDHLIPASLANSNDTIGRAFFYLEFARHLGHALLLSKDKRRWLDIMGEKLKLSLHEKLKQSVDAKMIDEAFQEQPVATPPVAELILYKAIVEGMPMIDAALEIRQSREAIDYRVLLSELRIAESSGSRPSIVQAQTKLRELDALVQQWRLAGDTSIGIVWKVRTLKFGKIPKIGWLADFAGMSEIKIHDLILNQPPGYLAFVASWYAPRH